MSRPTHEEFEKKAFAIPGVQEEYDKIIIRRNKILRVLSDRILAERCKAEEVTAGGIVLPPQAQEKCLFATVTAVGPDVKSIKVGDKVLFPKFAYKDVKVDDKAYLWMVEGDIMAVIEDNTGA